MPAPSSAPGITRALSPVSADGETWAPGAISRTGADGQPFGGWQPQERVGRETALAGYTVNAAYAGFAEGRFGRIAVGQRADLILVDRDPMLATPDELAKTQVIETWVGGQRVWRKGG